MAEGVIKKILAAELQQQILDDNIEVYPVTATSAVFDPKTNQSLDDILSSINTRIIQAAASGGGGGTISIAGQTYIWAFAGFKNDSQAIADIEEKANIRGIPSGWQESSNVDLQDGEMLYMTTARKQGDKWLTWTDGHIWSTPVRLGSSGTTSGTGSDGQGYNYIYCRTSTGQMPLFNVSVDFTELLNRVELASTQGEGILVQEIKGNVFYEPSMDPTDVWYDHPDGVTATIPYEWILVYQSTKDNWVPLTPQPILWSKYGVNGQDGDGVEYVFCTIQDTDDAPIIINNNTIVGTVNGTEYTVETTDATKENYYQVNEFYQQDDFIPDGWYDQPQEVNQLHPKQYVSIRKKKWVANEEKSKWGLFTEPKIWSEIPIVVSGLDKLSIDWSNDNVNVVTGESGDSLKAATDNYLTVKLGDTLLPYLPNTFDSTDENSYNISSVDITDGVGYERESYQGEEDAPAQARFYITSLPGTQRLYTVKFTLKVRVNGTVYTQYSTINIYVKDVAYELVVSPKGFNLSAIDTAAQHDLTVQVKMRNATTNRFLTGTEIDNLKGSFHYKFIKDGITGEDFEDIITAENTTLDKFKINCTSEDILDKCRAIEIELTSSDGYEDSETIMITRDGNTGDEGNGIEYIFYLATEDIIWVDADGNPIGDDNPASWDASQEPEYIKENSDWTDDLQEVTESNPVQYVSVRRFKRQKDGTKAWGIFEKPVVYNRWVPSPYSMSISNDSVIIDDNTDSITLANASFCQLHIFSGQDEITTNSDYTFEITPLANNGANDVFTLHIANQDEIDTINNNSTLTAANNDTWTFGSKKTFNTHSAIAFYITRRKVDTTLAVNSYGIQYQLIIKKSDSQVASLYKVQPIKVANFSADGTIYKLNITNDTWTYDGDTLNLVGPESSTVTVAEIKGATANQQTFTIGLDAVEQHSTGLYVKTSSDLISTTREGQLSYTIDPSNVKKGKYPKQSSYSLELYFNGILVDAETIDCRKDGKTGQPGAAGSSYYLTCDNDNIIVDLEATIADLNLLSAYTLQLWEQNTPITSGVNYSVTVPADKTGGLFVQSDSRTNGKKGCFSCSTMPTSPVSFQATAQAIYNSYTYTKTINVIIKQLQGEPGGPGVSYKLVVSPNSLHYDGNGGQIGGNNYSLTYEVTKISDGTATSITNNLKAENLQVEVDPTINNVNNVPYKIGGYDYTLKLKNTNNSEYIIVDKEHIDCLKDGKQGGTGPTGPEGNTTNVNGGFYVNFQDEDGPSLNFNFTASSVKYHITNVELTFQGSGETNRVYSFTTNNRLQITARGKLSYSNIHSVDSSSPWDFTGNISTSNTTGFAWGNYTTLTVKITMSNGSTTEHTIYRTGTDGYYFDSNSKGFISAYSSSDNLFKFAKTDVIKYDDDNYWQPSAYNAEIGEETYFHTLTFSNCQGTGSYYHYGESDEIGSGDEDVELFFFNKGTVSKVADGCTLVSCTPDSTGTVYTVKISLHNIQCDTFNNFNISSPNQCGTLKCLKVSTICSSSVNAYAVENGTARKAITEGIYTVSAYVRPVSKKWLATNSIQIEKFDGANIDILNIYSVTPNDSNWENWQRIYTTFKVTQAGKFNPLILVQQNSTTMNYYGIYITGVQLVKGVTPEPWSPYGNSMSMLLQNENSITQTVSQVTANKTNISKIQQHADSIDFRVNNSGLAIKDGKNTFTGNVEATNFTVVNTNQKPIVELTYYHKSIHSTVTSLDIEEGTPILVIHNINDQESYIVNLTKLSNTPGYTVYQVYQLTDGQLSSSGSIYYNQNDNCYYTKPNTEGIKVEGTYITGKIEAALRQSEGNHEYGNTAVLFEVLGERSDAYTLTEDTFTGGSKTASTSNYYKKDSNSNKYTTLNAQKVNSKNILFISRPCYDAIIKYGLNGRGTTTDLMRYLGNNYNNIAGLPDPIDFNDYDQEQTGSVVGQDIINFLKTTPLAKQNIDDFYTYINNSSLNPEYEVIEWQFNTSLPSYIYYA